MRFVAAPNEMDFAIYVMERWEAGDLDSWGGTIASALVVHDAAVVDERWSELAECLLSVDEDLAFEAELDYEDLTLQLDVRAGFEAPPWGLDKQEDPREPPELFLYWEHELEGYFDQEDYEYERAHDEDREDDPDAIRESLRIDVPNDVAFTPPVHPSGGFFVDGSWTLVWGDRLWRDSNGDLREHAEFSEVCSAYCQLEGALVLRRTRYEYFIRAADGWIDTAVPVPIMLPEGVAILGEQARTLLPICRPVPGVLGRSVISEPSACGRYLRIVDHLGRGGVFDRELRRVGAAGGPFTSGRVPILGASIDGRVADSAFWRSALPRFHAQRAEQPNWQPPSAFARAPNGAFRYTDNGVTFYEDGRLLFVLDRLAHCVSFSPSGHEAIVGYDDEVVRIDVEGRRTLARWSRPARLAWLRILLPAYEPDEYVEQIVSLWEILGINERPLDSDG